MRKLVFIVLLVCSFSVKAQELKWENDVAKACEASIKSKTKKQKHLKSKPPRLLLGGPALV